MPAAAFIALGFDHGILIDMGISLWYIGAISAGILTAHQD
jgi:hypothetical protein